MEAHEDTTIQETPLAPLHVALGAKMIPFAGWNMPVQYTGIMDEHKAVRTACGIFDISHMGQFFVSGVGVLVWLNSMFTNDTRKLGVGQGQYSIMLNEQGGVIDDLILYRVEEEKFLIVVNASMIEEDYFWMASRQPEGIVLENHSNLYAGMAVQGPDSPAIFAKLFPSQTLPPRNSVATFECEGETLWVCRTGYTGEDGYEFFCPSGSGMAWFKCFVEAGSKPCGLGARDSLRLEMCYPLNGSDLSPARTPLEAGLGFFCALETDFIGAEVLRAQKANGPAVRLVALKYTGRGAPPRAHYSIHLPSGEQIGELTSGVWSPSLGEGIGMGYVPVAHAALGTVLEIDVRGKKIAAEVVKKPFYKKA